MTSANADQRKIHNRRYYENGGKERSLARNTANRAARSQYVQGLKTSGCCTDCGGKFHPAAMHYDHVGSDKVANISRLVNELASYERINAEIAKCELVCANCHAVRTETRRASSKLVYAADS